jgi:very-short-patch-repair endonuclease
MAVAPESSCAEVGLIVEADGRVHGLALEKSDVPERDPPTT